MTGSPTSIDLRPATVLCIALGIGAWAGCVQPEPRVAQRVILIAPPLDLPQPAPAPPREAAPAPEAAVPLPVPAAPPAAPSPVAPHEEAVAPTPAAPPHAATIAAAPPPPPPPRAERAANARPQPADIVYFQPDAYKVDSRYRSMLQAHARKLKASPQLRMVLQAYADSRGDRDYNLALSKKRAETVARSLRALGVPADQLQLVYHGEGADNAARSERLAAAHRRVELVYVER